MKYLSMMKTGLLVTAVLASVSAFAETPVAPTTSPADAIFTTTQTTAIEKIVHDYLVNNPQVLIEAATNLQKQQQQQWQNTATKTVPEIAQQLFANPNSPVVGNINGDVTMVEFFDYQCPHCKEVGVALDDLMKSDKNLRVVFKALPIFGDTSVFAAKAGLAAQKQGKYLALHQALLAIPDRLTNDMVLKVAQQVGLNMQQLQKDMQDPRIAQEIQNNTDLAKKLKLTGTPGFVIAQTTLDAKTQKVSNIKNPILIPGAVDEETLAQAVAQVRGS